MTEPEITDEELRAMRDKVYPANTDKQIQTDEAWEMVKANCRKDAAWLKEKSQKGLNQ